MAHGFQIRNQNALHFVTITTVGWIDIFAYKRYRDIIVDSLNFCITKKGLVVHAWVIMSNHVHLICRAQEPYLLSNLIRDFKSFTAKEIIQEVMKNTESRKDWLEIVMKYHAAHNIRNDEFQVWQQDNHPIELESPTWISKRLQYIHNNPVRAGITLLPEEYIYSSAKRYAGMDGLVTVELLDIGPDIGFLHM
jgi:putative transposase